MPVTDENQPDTAPLSEPALSTPQPEMADDETPHEPCQGFAIGE